MTVPEVLRAISKIIRNLLTPSEVKTPLNLESRIPASVLNLSSKKSLTSALQSLFGIRSLSITSSKAYQGEADIMKEPCPYCGKEYVSDNAWHSLQQHIYRCKLNPDVIRVNNAIMNRPKGKYHSIL